MSLLAATSLLAVGCGDDTTGPDDDDQNTEIARYQLDNFDSCESLDDYLADQVTRLAAREYVYGYSGYYGSRGGVTVDSAMDDDVAAPTTGESQDFNDGGSPTDYTTTNLQEIGVDEADIFKTDGDYIYTIHNGSLYIVDSWPAEEASLVATYQLDGWGEQMFISGDRLIAFTQINEYGSEDYWDCGDLCGDGSNGTGNVRPGMPTDVTEPGDSGGSDDSSNGSTGDGSTGDGSSDDPPVDGGDIDVPDGDGIVDDGSDDVPSGPSFYGIRIAVLNITDRSNPTLVQNYDVEGYTVNARMVNDIVYVSSQAQGYNYDPNLENALLSIDGLPDRLEYPYEEAEAAALQAQVATLFRPVIERYINEHGRELFTPDVRIDDVREDLVECTEIYRPGVAAELGLLSVLGLDPHSDAGPQAVGLLANGWQVYGSLDRLYISMDSRQWWWEDNTDRFTETHIHAFDLNDGFPSYAASGSVEGWALNQFSMSEHNGYLRVATTEQTDQSWRWLEPGVADMDGGTATGSTTSTDDVVEPNDQPVDSGDDQIVEPEPEPEPENRLDASRVTVLSQQGQDLVHVGEVTGIGPGEQIFAVRFQGDRGYVVTFEQIDPLFTLDLSDPTSPAILGELQIPGFSSYLHPFGDDYLIGVGRDGDETGRVAGLQVQLFDVSDMGNPQRVAQHLISGDNPDSSWSYSIAEYDHHAFTFWETENLLAIPVTMEDWGADDYDYQYFSGILVLEVTADGFQERGRVSHTQMTVDAYCERTGDSVCESEEYAFQWSAWMLRSAFIDGYLYALSDQGLTASPVDSLSNVVAEIPFR